MNIAQYNKVWNKGIEVDREFLSRPLSISKVNKLEKLINKYSKEFGEEAVIAAWVQPYGGPVLAYKAHTKKEIEQIYEAYKCGKLKTAYPELGIYYDKAWCREERVRIRHPEPMDKKYPKHFIRFLKNFYSKSSTSS